MQNSYFVKTSESLNTTEHFMKVARQASEKSRCRRRKIGCILTNKRGDILAEGYNGTPLSMPSCIDEPCPDADLPAGWGPTAKCYGIHSEIRALLNVKNKDEINALYSVKAPCINCTLTLLETPCQEIYFDEISNDCTGLKLWEKYGRKWHWVGDIITKRIDKVTEINPSYRKTILPPPLSIKIEMTNKCNFSCGFCAHATSGIASGGKTNGDINWAFYQKIISDIRDSGVEELGMFYIGESLLYPDLADAIKYAKDIGFPYVFLTTNGSLASPEKINCLMKAGLDSLKFSINWSNMWEFRQITGRAPSGFEKIIDNVKSARKIRDDNHYSTKIYASSIKYDGMQFERMRTLVETLRPYIDEHYWLPLLSFGDSPGVKKLGYRPTVGNPGRADNMRQPLPCWAVFKEAHITYDGKLSACCFDASDKWVMADLNIVSFMDGWNSKEFQNLRLAHLSGDVHSTPCQNCIHGGD